MSAPMTTEELKACRERAEKATGLSPADVRGGAFTWDGDAALLSDIVDTADALAELRTDVPRLLATVEHATARAERAEALLTSLAEVFEAVSREAERPKVGVRAPFHGVFCSAVGQPSLVGEMAWWAREIRNVLAKNAHEPIVPDGETRGGQ